MEEKRTPHNLILQDRKRLSVTQVMDVDTFDESKIVLFTAEDTIEIEGNNLHIQKLDVSEGELIIDGDIISVLYSDKSYGVKGKGLFKKLLK